MGEFASGICFADISTAQISASSSSGESFRTFLRNELGTYSPREVVCNLNLAHMGEVGEFLQAHPEITVSDGQSFRFDPLEANARLREQFGQTGAKGLESGF